MRYALIDRRRNHYPVRLMCRLLAACACLILASRSRSRSARARAPDGIRVNAICPGFIDTDITAGKLTDAMRDSILAEIPMGRTGKPADVAGCALFLASNLSAYCIGTEVDVNGGSLIH